jgi:glutamate-1-semialdehyde 2,1-aminomutase
MKWYEDSKLFKYSHEDLEQCEQFHIVGGEPLLIEEHYDVLTKFVESGRAKNVSLDYNSNLTHVPTRVIKLWENFKEVKIGVSIDGLGPVNDYIRYPSKWENVEKNLQKVANSKVPLLMWITLTVMVYNIFEIPKLLKWQIQHGGKYFSQLDWLLFLVPHPLHNPVHLSAAVLPKEVKNQVRSVYHDFQHGWFEDYLSNSDLDEESRQRYRERMANIIENIIACMDQRDNVQYLDDFFKYTDSMDRYRDQSFEESLPMLYNALSPYRKL